MTMPLKILYLALFLLLAGCATDNDPYQGMPENVIYTTAHTYLQKGNDSDAIKAYQSLDSQYPFTDQTQKGDLDIIYAYYDHNDPELALTAASRYLKLYPNDPNAAYAYYMMGILSFENGRGFLQRYFPYDMAEHDADNYVTAFNNFSTLVTHYPESPYVPDAKRRMIYLNNTLALFELRVAQFYLIRGAYVAAIDRAQAVLLHYPNSPSVNDAFTVMISAYDALGLSELSTSAKQVLAANRSRILIDGK